MTIKEKIYTKSIDYGQKTPSEYDDGRYDFSDLELAFEEGAKWANKTMIDKMCEWLKNNTISVTNDTCTYTASSYDIDKEEFIEQFKKAMKGSKE